MGDGFSAGDLQEHEAGLLPASGLVIAGRQQAGAVRMAPLSGETTLSFLSRLSGGYRVGVKDLIAALVGGESALRSRGNARPDGEVYLIAEVCSGLAQFCQIPEAHLEWALPAWRQRPQAAGEGAPIAQFRFGAVVPATGVECRLCSAARTGTAAVVRRYASPPARVCLRHQRWLADTHCVDRATLLDVQVSLEGLPEVLAAHRRLMRLGRRMPLFSRALEVAQAVVVSWWDAHWPIEEAWSHRRERIAQCAPDGPWQILARDIVTYPETVTVAAVLASAYWQRRVFEGTDGHRPRTLGAAPSLLAELARRLQRPWLPEQISDQAAGPLYAWLIACVRSEGGRGSAAAGMWAVHPAHRPRSLAQLRGRRAHSEQAGQGGPGSADDAGFAAGLAHARAYAAVHGHLAVPKYARFNGFSLGRWLSNQRSEAVALAPGRVAALEAIDVWWNPPWFVSWHRFYHRALAHTQAHGPVDAGRGFPGTSTSLGEWLYNQCLRYTDLHPAQQELLNRLGISPEAVQVAMPRRRNSWEPFAIGLGHARAYAAVHGHLAMSKNAEFDGFLLGRWLMNQRIRSRAPGLGDARDQALAALDPWWNPPWPLSWQQAYYQARARTENGGSPTLESDAASGEGRLGAWLYAQRVQFDELHPDQQRLLSGIGITASATAYPSEGHPAERGGQRNMGLTHARAYAAAHGHLAVAYGESQNGFALGRWLRSQRTRDRIYGERSPTVQALTALDPWWNPPWDFTWQRFYQQARSLAEHAVLDAGRGFPGADDRLAAWLHAQCLLFDELQPGQQHLLAGIGITASTAACAQIRRSPAKGWAVAAGLPHACAYAAAHGHLAASHGTVHDGFPLGEWLRAQRRRARHNPTDTPVFRVLATLDPWWNPPWDFTWQRIYQQYRAACGSAPPALERWARKQTSLWDRLHPHQQALLSTAGIHPEALRR
ncbi:MULTISPECIES: helicase associated domain-containing protein [unclassified Streptomyces]|uniref:helicase associated domain-containing protein n=1 Tax=unclassified Streptomyces TaxID=2593676 RepID=UPI00380C15FF